MNTDILTERRLITQYPVQGQEKIDLYEKLIPQLRAKLWDANAPEERRNQLVRTIEQLELAIIKEKDELRSRGEKQTRFKRIWKRVFKRLEA